MQRIGVSHITALFVIWVLFCIVDVRMSWSVLLNLFVYPCLSIAGLVCS